MTKINPGQAVCGCGSNIDAFETALKMARANIKVAPGDEDVCPRWHLAVAISYLHIVQQFAHAQDMTRLAEAHAQGNRVGVTRADGVEALTKIMEQTDVVQMAALLHNTELNKDLAKFICEEIGAGDEERDVIEKGPPESLFEGRGFTVEVISPDELLAAILRGGSKTH